MNDGGISMLTVRALSDHSPSSFEAITLKTYLPGGTLEYSAIRRSPASIHLLSRPSMKYRKRTRSGIRRLGAVYLISRLSMFALRCSSLGRSYVFPSALTDCMSTVGRVVFLGIWSGSIQ